jgi:CheY-like chemotaxis protein
MGKIRSVLIVDDDEISSYITHRALRRSGVVDRIAVARNGKDALTYLSAVTAHADKETDGFPDVILLDMHMPVMDGFDFLSEYDKRYSYRAKCSIFPFLCTADESLKSKIDGNRPYVCGFVRKPMTDAAISQIRSSLGLTADAEMV